MLFLLDIRFSDPIPRERISTHHHVKGKVKRKGCGREILHADRTGIGTGGGKLCAFDGGVVIARIRFVDKQGGRRTTHPHARFKNWTNIVKIIYVAFSGEEEPSEEAQKVKLEIRIDKKVRF